MKANNYINCKYNESLIQMSNIMISDHKAADNWPQLLKKLIFYITTQIICFLHIFKYIFTLKRITELFEIK